MRDFTATTKEKHALLQAVEEVAEKVQGNYLWFCCERHMNDDGEDVYTEYTDEDTKAKIKAYDTIMKALEKLI